MGEKLDNPLFKYDIKEIFNPSNIATKVQDPKKLVKSFELKIKLL